MKTTLSPCKNCNDLIYKSDTFCSKCGFRTDEKLNLSVLFRNTVANYFSVDSRLFNSILPLVFKPGHLAKEFIYGKRLKYLHPAQFYLFVTIVFFFIFSFEISQQEDVFEAEFNNILKIDNTTVAKADSLGLADNGFKVKVPEQELAVFSKMDSLNSINASTDQYFKAFKIENDGSFESQFFEQLIKLNKLKGRGLINKFYSTIPVAMFFLLPVFAALLMLFFRKTNSYTEHLIFSFYFFVFIFFMLTLITILGFMINIPAYVFNLIYLSILVYLILAVRNFYKKSILTSTLRILFLAIIYLVLVLPVTIATLVVITFFFF